MIKVTIRCVLKVIAEKDVKFEKNKCDKVRKRDANKGTRILRLENVRMSFRV